VGEVATMQRSPLSIPMMPTYWAACLEGCVEAGASSFLELGPGRGLVAMAAGAYPNIPARSLEDFRTLQGVRTWLSRVECA
jgi:[acyl-carrier-protein] S-malonyltransferase